MRIVQRLTMAGMLLLLGCSTPPPSAPPPFTTVLNLKQLMNWVIDPSADVIWDSVKSIMTTSGTSEIAPKTEEQWAAVRTGAATLVEAGNLLMLEGRAKDSKEWMAAARRLSASAELALKAAEENKADALFNAGGDIYNACKGCHDRYAFFDQKPPTPTQPAK